MAPEADGRAARRSRRGAGSPERAAPAAADRGGFAAALGLAAASLAVAFGAAELAARIWLAPPRYHRDPLHFDPELGFRGIPGYREELSEAGRSIRFELNAQGLRGRALPAPGAPRAAGVQRILFVGDSFLVGRATAEPELATSRVESALRARGREVEVYNLASIDWGTAQELLALRSAAPALRPDSVILFLYLPNDVINNHPGLAGPTILSPGDPIRPYLAPGDRGLRLEYLQPLRAFARRHSRLFGSAEAALLARAGANAAPHEVAAAGGGGVPREDLELFRRHGPDDVWERAWERTAVLLRAFRDECRAQGSRLLVVVVPSVYQVARSAKLLRLDIVSQLRQGRALDRIVDWNLPERRIRDLFEAESIEYRLLLPELRAASAAGLGVYARDEHLSAAGFEVAAAAVLGWLEGAPAPPRDALAGAPVPILAPAAEAPAMLDFGRAPHAEQLGDGWYTWSAASAAAPGGWKLGASALAVLPGRDGALVVDGYAEPDAPLPLQLRLALLGGRSYEFRIDAPGAFRARAPELLGRAGARAASDGYVALGLRVSSARRAPLVYTGLRIRGLGIEPQGAAAQSAAPRSPGASGGGTGP